MYQSHENGFVIQGGFVFAAVDAGGFNDGSLAAGLLNVNPGTVEPAEVVDYGHHEFEGVVCFQPEALEALHSV